MKATVFNGRKLAKSKEDQLVHKIAKLQKKPVIATIMVGYNLASRLYVNLKQKAALRIGAEMDLYEYSVNVSHDVLVSKINSLNKDKTVDGIMIQLPLPGVLANKTGDILNHIAPSKDVDGLRENSPFDSATTRAVIAILDEAKKHVTISPDSYIVVVGAKGEIGSRIISKLTGLGHEVGALDIDTDKDTFIKETKSAKILISATGKNNLITGQHVKNGAVVIDVGSPKGDVLFNEVVDKASFLTPVPGGVGPMTVVSLMENLVDAASKKKKG